MRTILVVNSKEVDVKRAALRWRERPLQTCVGCRWRQKAAGRYAA